MTDFPDALADIREWLRTQPDLAAIHGGRVWYKIPTNPSGSPFMRLYRAGGGVQPGTTPIQDLRVAMEMWAMPNASGAVDYDSLRLLVQTLEGVCFDLQSATPVGESTTIRNIDLQTIVESPDPQTDPSWPRFIAPGAVFTVTHS